MKLPYELQCLILYRYGGLEHPTARIMKPVINDVWKEATARWDPAYDMEMIEDFYLNNFIYETLCRYDVCHGGKWLLKNTMDWVLS